MDPNSIAQLLAHHPYHIDALLAMLELYRCVSDRGALHLLQNPERQPEFLGAEKKLAWLLWLNAAS